MKAELQLTIEQEEFLLELVNFDEVLEGIDLIEIDDLIIKLLDLRAKIYETYGEKM